MSTGSLGWVTLVAHIWCWDKYGRETLSAAFRKTRNHTLVYPMVIVTWATVTAHLFAFIPERYDPFQRLFSPRKA